MICLDLPAFRTNAMYRGGRRYKTTEYTKWLSDGQWLLKGHQKVAGEVEITIRCWIRNYGRSDLDGVIKPLLDLLVVSGLIEDDRFVKKLTAEKFQDKNERIEVEIEPYGD